MSGGAAPLFILSFRHRDELTRIAQAAGWQPIAARRLAGAEGRFVDSGAWVAVVDARGALPEGQEAVRALGDAVETNGGALLVLVSRTDVAALEALHAAGATHFLASPFTEPQIVQALRFAARHAERLAGGRGVAAASRRAASWRWQPGSRTVELSAALARQAGLGSEAASVPLLELFRRLDPAGRRAARDAAGRVLAGDPGGAFAHGLREPGIRMAHHIGLDAAQTGLVGRTEWLGRGSDEAAGRDPLTGLRGRNAVRLWLDRRRDTAAATPLVLVLVAATRFDTVNAAFGQAAGDAVLGEMARRIERIMPAGRDHLAARVAGAEFALLISGAEPDDGRRLAAALLESLGRPIMAGGHVVSLGCRAGVVAAAPAEDVTSLLRRGSAALASAKQSEGGPLQVGASGGAADLDVDLRRALTDGDIDIVYQPQVSIATGRIVGVEALARWRHPVHGELGAGTLFEVAERSDFLAPLSDHVQHKVIAEAASWPAALRTLRVAVNITAADIARPGFAESFAALVAGSGFAPERLTVEVTESNLIEDLGAAATLLAKLRESRLRVAIDDFGTGSSSRAYLKSLPLDYLKIDKSLTQDISGSQRDRIVVRSVIDMARSLGLEVIAEGVETAEQLELLAREGCTLYQGFLCAPPLDNAALLRLVETRRAA